MLADIGRRAVDVWSVVPQRLPAPVVDPGPMATTPSSGGRFSRRRILALGGVLATGAAVGGGVWWRGRASSGGGGDTTGTSRSAPEARNLDPLWQYEVHHTGMEYEALVVPHTVPGTVIVPTGGNTEGVNASNGDEKWQSTTWESGWQMVVTDGQIYRLGVAPSTDSMIGSAVTLQTSRPDSGKTIKTLARFAGTNDQLLGAHQLLNISDGVAYVAVGAGKASPIDAFLATQTWTLRAADLESGTTLWSKDLPRRPDKSLRHHFLAAKAVGDLLVTFQEVKEWTVHIVVRNRRTGAVVWDKPYDVLNPDVLRGEIAVDDRYLYLGGAHLRAVRLSDGAQVWASKDERRYGPPTLKAGVVYSVGANAGLTAVDAAEGQVLWTEQGGEVDEAFTGWRPIVGTRYAYYKNGALLRAISLSHHGTASTYQTTGKSFYEHAQSKLVLAVDLESLAAYPLK
ncbi:PQQ-binding-like beta-propeller repeat protein [Streptomyces sp. NPDC005538]|uniref:outer membrane protein assembly factor BamB family protein n=1 Tax=unclassified Streptomyces TaxID=2593676 RepID=UPI0033B430E2